MTPPRRPGVLKRLSTDTAGLALVEFALIAPIMIAMYFGCVEFCLAMMANKRASHTAAVVGDLVAQNERLSTNGINDIFRVARTSMLPYRTTTLRVRITQFQRTTETQMTRVGPSCHKNWAPRNSAAGIPLDTVPVGAVLLWAESEYDHQSTIRAFLPGLTRFDAALPYRPRRSTQVFGQTTTDWTCPATSW